MAWISAVQVAKQILSVVSVSILARRIPPAAYGIMGMAVLVTNLLETIRDLGTGTALIRHDTMSEDLASTGFWLNCGMGLLVTLLVVACSYPAAIFFHEPRVTPILQLLSLSTLFGALGVVPTALLNRAMEFRKIALSQALGAVLGSAAAIVIALKGGQISALVTAALLSSLATSLAVWFLAPFRLRAVYKRDEAREILLFGTHLTGVRGLNYFSRNADNVVVGRYLGSSPLGFYQMAYMLMTYPLSNFTLLISQVALPAVSTFKHDLVRFRTAYLRLCQVISLVTFPLMFGLAVTATPFIRVFLGPRWMPVAGLLLVFGPLGALQSVVQTTNLIYNAQGRQDINFRWTLFASVSYVISFVIGLKWGIMGVATCYSIVWLVLMIPGLIFPFRLIKLPLKTFFRALWPTTWCSIAMACVAALWQQGIHYIGVKGAFYDLLSTTVVGAVTYILLLWWRRPPALGELSGVIRGSSHPLARLASRVLPGPAKVRVVLGAE